LGSVRSSGSIESIVARTAFTARSGRLLQSDRSNETHRFSICTQQALNEIIDKIFVVRKATSTAVVSDYPLVDTLTPKHRRGCLHPPQYLSNIRPCDDLDLDPSIFKTSSVHLSPQLHQPKFGEIPSIGLQDIVLTGRMPVRTQARTEALTTRITRKHNASAAPIGGGRRHKNKHQCKHSTSKSFCYSFYFSCSFCIFVFHCYIVKHQPEINFIYFLQQRVTIGAK